MKFWVSFTPKRKRSDSLPTPLYREQVAQMLHTLLTNADIALPIFWLGTPLAAYISENLPPASHMSQAPSEENMKQMIKIGMAMARKLSEAYR
ncbi:MAG: hypothetical protein H6636_03175 [Anaerolineales bacterium]|nr:hypothetical protein [Anaerolineales bacterium]